jgi:hypothetical protein
MYKAVVRGGGGFAITEQHGTGADIIMVNAQSSIIKAY